MRASRMHLILWYIDGLFTNGRLIMKRNNWLSLILGVLMTLAVVGIYGCWQTSRAPAAATATVATPAIQQNDGSTIAYSQLPPEAQDVITRIKAHGTFEFKQDGQTFQNRERILPQQPRGYYKEYTVITPNATNRGARRIIAGQPNEFYYTADHYRSFYRVK